MAFGETWLLAYKSLTDVCKNSLMTDERLTASHNAHLDHTPSCTSVQSGASTTPNMNVAGCDKLQLSSVNGSFA